MRDIACIKPTIENTDPAFAVGMQASCLVCDGTACGTVPMRRKRWLHKAAKRIPTLWIRKGFQSTLYTARRVFCFDDWISLCNIQNKCACSKQICILISSLQRFAGKKMSDTDSACFIPHCKSTSFLLKNAHSFEWVFLIFLFVKRSLMKKQRYNIVQRWFLSFLFVCIKLITNHRVIFLTVCVILITI